MKSFQSLAVFILFSINLLYGQAADEPQDLNSDVNIATDWSTVTTIENSFNAARRAEETQLGLGTNAIQDLDLPDQTTWNGYSIDQRALYIMNDERTARAGVNYGMGGVKGLPFNGIEANIDQVAQNWAQYNVDNNVFEHCHPTMNNADCPAGRIDAAYPNGCTEFGGGIENLHASSSGTISFAEVALDAIFGWIYQDAGSAWGHRHAMLSQSYDDDYGEAMQEGLVGFGIAQTTNAAVQWKTVVVINFTNPVADAQAGNCGYNITVSTNSLTNPNPCMNPPVISSVTVQQPTDCNNQTGSITINATGAGTLEYTVNGNSWQNGSVFPNLPPGNYPVSVRLQGDQSCKTDYNQNPVAINTAKGVEFSQTNLNLGIPDNDLNGVESTVNVPSAGQISNVRVTNLTGTHTYVADLTITLISPQGTMVVLIQGQCTNMDDFSISLDDDAPNAISCPLNAGNTEMPDNPLTAFDGEDQMGTWRLKIVDDGGGDVGVLNSWTLEICTQGGMVAGYTCATAIDITAAGTFNAPAPNQGNGATDNTVATHAIWYKFTPPMTGMVRVFTCGLTGAGNQHNHVFNNACPASVNDVVYTTDRGCAGNPNDPAVGLLLENIAVTAGVPIYIEWDDALSSTAFTWTLEYQSTGGNNCTEYVANDIPITIPDNATGTITSTINVLSGGVITDVNIKNLNGPHTYVGDLTFTLMSPQGTSLVLIQNQCGNSNTGFNINLDDQAGMALNCPLSSGDTEQPQNALSAFNGENPMGNWQLMINDNFAQDGGTLSGWTLEICIQGGGGNCPQTLAVNDNPIGNGTYQAGNQLTSSGTIGLGNNVTFRAGNHVELQPNFTVPQSSIFEIRIEGCQ